MTGSSENLDQRDGIALLMNPGGEQSCVIIDTYHKSQAIWSKIRDDYQWGSSLKVITEW